MTTEPPILVTYCQEPSEEYRGFRVDIRMDFDDACSVEPEDYVQILLDAASIALRHVQDVREGKW